MSNNGALPNSRLLLESRPSYLHRPSGHRRLGLHVGTAQEPMLAEAFLSVDARGACAAQNEVAQNGRHVPGTAAEPPVSGPSASEPQVGPGPPASSGSSPEQEELGDGASDAISRAVQDVWHTQVGNHQADLEALRNEVSARLGEFREELREAFEERVQRALLAFQPALWVENTVTGLFHVVLGDSATRCGWKFVTSGHFRCWGAAELDWSRLVCWRCSPALHDQVAPQVGRAVSGNIGAVVAPCEPFAPVDSSAPPTPALVAEPPVSGPSASEPLWGASKTQAEQ